MANKKEVVESIAIKSGLTKVDAEKALKGFIESIEEFLEKKEKVSLVGFGVFETVETKGRTGVINFGEKKGQVYQTADGFKPKFTASKSFKDIVNK